MTLRYDLHSHSTFSDGTLSPLELVTRAHAQGVQALALTDHDLTDGLAAARAAAQPLGLELIAGVEISVTWHGQTLHIVGLHIDAQHAALQQGLGRLREFRNWRAAEMGRRLERHGIADACAGAQVYAQGAIISRTHFARFLVAQGHARELQEVFKHFLVHGKPGHVAGEWANLEDAVAWIHGAGGQAVIAHPARYKLTATRMRQLLKEFKDYGGAGIEVISGSHSRDDSLNMAGYARQFELLASAGSDYHGPHNPWLELGRLPALPAGCKAIWEDWPVRYS